MPSNVAETVLAVQPSRVNIALSGKNNTKAGLSEYPTKRVETSKTTVTADSCYTSVLRRTRLSKNVKSTMYCVVYTRLGGLQGSNIASLYIFVKLLFGAVLPIANRTYQKKITCALHYSYDNIQYRRQKRCFFIKKMTRTFKVYTCIDTRQY